MASFKNETAGARAVLMRDRSYVLIEAGEEATFADAAVVSYPTDLTVIASPAPADDRRTMLESLTDEALRAFVEKVTGKAPHPNAKRETLIEKALADPAQ